MLTAANSGVGSGVASRSRWLVSVAFIVLAGLSSGRTRVCRAGERSTHVAVAPKGTGLWGTITLAAGGRKHTFPIGTPTQSRKTPVWHLRRRISQDCSPLWRGATGESLAREPSYRGRRFTQKGELIGREIVIVTEADLRLRRPAWATGVQVRISMENLEVTAHRYSTSWGRISGVTPAPHERGRLPDRRMVLAAGSRRGPVAMVRSGEHRFVKVPGRADVVRLAGCAFGLGLGFVIEVRFHARRELAVAMQTDQSRHLRSVEGLAAGSAPAGKQGSAPDNHERAEGNTSSTSTHGSACTQPHRVAERPERSPVHPEATGTTSALRVRPCASCEPLNAHG